MKIPLGALAIIFGLSGCTSLQLQRNTLAQGRTWTEMQYGMVLDNLAMFRQAPDSLPWHLTISQGSTAVNDTLMSNFSHGWPTIMNMLGLSGSRGLQDNWTVVPISDAKPLSHLRKIYAAYCRAPWIHDGVGPRGCFGGHFRSSYVWVGSNDVASLTDVTLQVLDATTPKDKPKSPGPVLLPGPVPQLVPP